MVVPACGISFVVAAFSHNRPLAKTHGCQRDRLVRCCQENGVLPWQAAPLAQSPFCENAPIRKSVQPVVKSKERFPLSGSAEEVREACCRTPNMPGETRKLYARLHPLRAQAMREVKSPSAPVTPATAGMAAHCCENAQQMKQRECRD